MNALADLLRETGGSLGWSIPLLDDRLAKEVAVATLLFLVARAIEDAESAAAHDRLGALLELSALAVEPDEPDGNLVAALDVVRDHAGDATGSRLLASAPVALAMLGELDPGAGDLIASHLARSCKHVAGNIAWQRPPETIEQLSDACYAVAGIQCELFTDLFVNAHAEPRAVAQDLRELAAGFGEALRLIDVLGDEHAEAEREHPRLPPGMPVGELIAHAGDDLTEGVEYVAVLEAAHAPPAVVAFNAFNAWAAIESLAAVRDRDGGVPLAPPGYERLVKGVQRCIAEGGPVTPLLDDAIASAGFVD